MGEEGEDGEEGGGGGRRAEEGDRFKQCSKVN